MLAFADCLLHLKHLDILADLQLWHACLIVKEAHEDIDAVDQLQSLIGPISWHILTLMTSPGFAAAIGCLQSRLSRLCDMQVPGAEGDPIAAGTVQAASGVWLACPPTRCAGSAAGSRMPRVEAITLMQKNSQGCLKMPCRSVT